MDQVETARRSERDARSKRIVARNYGQRRHHIIRVSSVLNTEEEANRNGGQEANHVCVESHTAMNCLISDSNAIASS